MTDPALVFVLTVSDHVCRRYILPLVLLAATVLRYNVFSLVYLILFLVGVLITAPRQKNKRAGCIAYLIIVLSASVLFTVSQALFQISLATGPTFDFCDTIEVVLRQIGLVQFVIKPIDIVRYLAFDILTIIASAVSLGIAIKLATLHGEELVSATTAGSSTNAHSATPTGTDDASDSATPTSTCPSPASEQSNLSAVHPAATNLSPPQSYYKLPQWTLIVFDIVIFFLLLLCGVAVPSIVSFWYFAMFLVLSFMWSIHFRHAPSVTRVLKTISMFYTAVHILVLYLYQFQSFQLVAPSESFDNVNQLVVRLFGLTPIIETSCVYPVGLLVWNNVPISNLINPWGLLLLYWILASDCHLWISTPQPFWSLYYTYCVPKLASRNDTLRIQRKGHSNTQHYGSTDSHRASAFAEAMEAPNADQVDSLSEIQETLNSSKPLAGLLSIKEKLQHYIIELWNVVMSLSYVFSLVAMMVWSVLYPSWPALILLLWAVAIWVIPRINPKQSLQYSSPFLVIYATALLILSYINALPVTSTGYNWEFKVGIECKYYNGNSEECLSLALGAKCLLSLAFFASLRQLIDEVKKRREHQGDEPLLSTIQPHSSTDGDSTTASKMFIKLYKIGKAYWILVVLLAFLMVILVGEPSALKTIYLISLFIFFLVYQLFRKWWVVISYPLWWLLVVYAALHLVIVYTFQFKEISDLWYQASENFNYTQSRSQDIFRSVGLTSSDTNDSSALFNLLVPLGVFTAVIALQVRYFSSKELPDTSSDETDLHHRLSMGQVLTRVSRAFALTDIEFDDIERDIERKEKAKEMRRERLKSSQEAPSSSSEGYTDIDNEQWEMAGSKESTPIESTSIIFTRFLLYSLIKLRQGIIVVWHLFWRFFEIHTSKLIMVAIFAYGLYEPSASYFFVIVCAVIITPFAPWTYLNHFIYPVLTVVIGILAVAKYIYQVPVIKPFNFDKNCTNFSSSDGSSALLGQIFHYTFFPQSNDSSWLGLNQSNHPTQYIGSLIGVAILICFWYASKRHQAFYYNSKNIVVESWESSSIFTGINYQEIHTSSVEGLKFLVNHWFDMYGIEVCFVFEAILVATRIDVYGIVYVVILGLMLIAPRSLLSPVWLLFLAIHGLALILQYGLLVGLPPSYLCNHEGYVWDSVFSNTSYAVIMKWLYLPHYGSNILNKYLLYGDVFAYILICLQMKSFIFKTMKALKDRQLIKDPPYVYKTRYWFDAIKILLFQYSFWVALFILFATAATRLSAIGLIYLLLCFIFLYRGQNLLTDIKRIRLRWWVVLRGFIWCILLLQSILQFISCVFSHDFLDNSKGPACVLISVFNIRCSVSHYYGVSKDEITQCNNHEPSNVGLWLDVLAFAFVSLQIILLDTVYSEQVRDNVLRKEENAQNFAKVSSQLAEEKKRKAQETEAEDLLQLKQRAEQLQLTKGRIDHFLYAGVRVPKDYLSSVAATDEELSLSPIKSKPPDEPLIAETQEDADGSGTETEDENENEDKNDVTQDTDDEISKKSQLEVEKGFIKRGLQFLLDLWLMLIDKVIEWLETNSDDYRRVVSKLKKARYHSGKDVLLEEDEEFDKISLTADKVRKSRESSREPATTLHEESRPLEEEESRPLEEEEVRSKLKDEGASSTKKLSPSRTAAVTRRSPNFDELGDIFVEDLQPSPREEQRAQEIQSKFEDFTKRHTERPRRFLSAFYYWCLSHFEYVVFFFVVVAILVTGSFPSFIYAGLLFLWGLLSLPIPSKRFWLALIFYTMLVIFTKYISFFVFSLNTLGEARESYVYNQWLGIPGNNMFAWLFGIDTQATYFTNAVVNLLLLMTLMFQRGLLKQYGLWRSEHFVGEADSTDNFLTTLFKTAKQFFKKITSSSVVAGRKDYYIGILACDVLCFLTIVFGYSSFSVTANTGTDLIQAANYIQSNNIPIPFLIMLIAQFLSMLVDRAIYVKHSVVAKLIFYIILLIGWHLYLLILVPVITHKSFYDNTAAQILYFFKAIYFILSALQIISGYPTRLLGYFVGSSYSTISGLLFMGYRLVPIIPELREVTDWVFTKTSLSFIHWLRVQELWAQLYQVKVRRMREKNSPRSLGDEQSLISKLSLGGGLVILLVLLVWGPLIFMSVVNQASVPNPPTSVTISLELEGFQLLEIYGQSQFIFSLTSDQYRELRNKVKDRSFSVWSEFPSLFRQEDFRYILLPANTSLIWTASESTKEQLGSILNPSKNATLTFSWNFVRSVQGLGDETISGRYNTNITSTTVGDFIEVLDSSNNHSSVRLERLYPFLIYSPNTGISTEFTELSRITPNETFNGTATLTTNSAYTLTSRECIDNLTESCVKSTTITESWSLNPDTNSFLTATDSQKEVVKNAIELVVYSQRVSPSYLSFVASIGVIGLYVSVVFAIGRLIRGYVSDLPQNLLIDQISYPDPLLKLCDDIFFVREMNNLVLEEILVGKLYYIFRSPERLISLTEKQQPPEKPKTD